MCCRCKSTLQRPSADPTVLPLAFAVAAALALMLALAFPIVTLNVQPEPISTTLFDTIEALWRHDMRLLAILVAVTTITAPVLEILAVMHVAIYLHAGTRPPCASMAMRLLRALDEWNMTEVFVLGALVALVKLDDYAQVQYGIALWSLGALMALLVAIGASFDTRAIWARWEAAR